MQRLLLLMASALLILAWLSPDHYTPWLTFSSELLTFASAMCLLGLYLDKNLLIPKMQWFWGVVCLIPLVQWCFGLEFYFGKALLASLYLFAFGMVCVLGFNLAKDFERGKILNYFSLIVFFAGLATASIALLQWLQLEKHIMGLMPLRGNRPYANFAQPNNMATFLLMSLMGAFYLFEKRLLKTWMLAGGAFILLFTIALSQSRTPWIACFILTGYLLLKHRYDNYRLRKLTVVMWALVYIFCLLVVPYLNQFLYQFGFAHTEMSNIVARANSSHSRLGIWTQMLYAINEQPWWGYGWNQTSIAQLDATKFYIHPERTNSAHNLLLELLVWNGVILGGAIITYLSYWIYRLNQVVKSKETVIATLMVVSVLLHMMLEFPQNYAYFLLPVGFLLGFIQSYIPNQRYITLKSGMTTVILVGSILLYGLIWRDYIVSVNTLFDAKEKSDQGLVDKTKILVLDQFSERAQWYALNRFSHLDVQQMQRFEHVVQTTPSHYDLFKYAQLQAYNGNEMLAKEQLFQIKALYNLNHFYENLLKKRDKDGNLMDEAVK